MVASHISKNINKSEIIPGYLPKLEFNCRIMINTKYYNFTSIQKLHQGNHNSLRQHQKTGDDRTWLYNDC